MGIFSAFIGAMVGLVPLLGYGIAMMVTGSQIISLATQGVSVLAMFVIAKLFAPRLLKD
jgi:hypothetical protein